MAHFARINNQNIVEEVLVIDKDVVDTGLFGDPNMWIQTSYNTRGGIHYDPITGNPSDDQSKALRKNYAGIGYTYDAKRDAFIPPNIFPSWIFDEISCTWKAPIVCPNDDKRYAWDEPTKSWIEIVL